MKNLPLWHREDLLQSPFFEPLHAVLQRYGKNDFPNLADYNELLADQPSIATQSGKQIKFVEQGLGKLGFEAQYEPRCYLSGEVQTRENNLHDLFNALVWLIFPQSKAAINARHYAALTNTQAALTSQRGSVRDMATLLDESGVIVPFAEPHLAELLRDFKWKELFFQNREKVNSAMGFYIFGHGLYEKAIQPYLGFTGQGLLLQVDEDFFAWPRHQRLQHLDERVAAYLNEPSNCQDTYELSPVPLLGIPGWSKDNEKAEYYDNQNYFRAGRARAL
ncbi:MAG: DUF3025 domain-containing protein [Gallionellaceae bacterium]|nr:DUF3025 domain-containing protein [Gallionellaceae bacterium]